MTAEMQHKDDKYKTCLCSCDNHINLEDFKVAYHKEDIRLFLCPNCFKKLGKPNNSYFEDFFKGNYKIER